MFCVFRANYRSFEISCVDRGSVLQENLSCSFVCVSVFVVFVFFLDPYPRSNLVAKEPEPESETAEAQPDAGEETTNDSSA